MKNSRAPRIIRAVIVCGVAFLVTLVWSISQWLHIPHRIFLMLGWLAIAPFLAAVMVLAVILSVGPLLPRRPLAPITTFIIPVLHVAFTLTVATLLIQRSSPIIDLSEPQRFVSVWTQWRLLIPVGGLEAVMIGLSALVDQILVAQVSSAKG